MIDVHAYVGPYPYRHLPHPDPSVLVGVLAFAAWQGRLGDNLLGGVWQLGPWQLHPLSILFLLLGVFGIYMLVQLGFLKGTPGANNYGADPLGYAAA